MLLPKKLGVEANSKNIERSEASEEPTRTKWQRRSWSRRRALAAEIAEKSMLTVSIKVGEGGKIFGSVSSKEIAEAAKAQIDLELDKKKIQLPSPIRTLGVTMVPVKLHPKVTAELKVHVKEA